MGVLPTTKQLSMAVRSARPVKSSVAGVVAPLVGVLCDRRLRASSAESSNASGTSEAGAKMANYTVLCQLSTPPAVTSTHHSIPRAPVGQHALHDLARNHNVNQKRRRECAIPESSSPQARQIGHNNLEDNLER